MPRLTTYNLRFDDRRIGALVKEDAINYTESTVVDCPEKAAKILNDIFDAKNLVQEYFWMMALDGGRKVSGLFVVSIGTLTASLVHPREVFQRALLAGAASIIIAHNHPSGATDVSEQDREVTRRIRKAGELLGIKLDDHIIIADGDHVSAI